MKVLLTHRPGGAYGYITDGWLNALRDRGHEVRRWDGMENTWHEYDPDLYMGCSGHKQPIPPHNNCKIAIHVNPCGPVNIDGINETNENITWTITQKPDVVFGYGYEDDRLLWSDWSNKHNIPWVPMPTAGDAILFGIAASPEERPYDIVYLGGHWKYKGQTLDSYLLPALRIEELKYRVCGWGDWPPGICDGILPENEAKGFLNSGRVGPCISEIHTHQYGIDVPERAFKVALCGALVIHDPVPVIRKILPHAVVAQNTENFVNLCRNFTRPENAAERQELAEKQRQDVLSAHTYHHRIKTLFSALGFAEEAKGMLDS